MKGLLCIMACCCALAGAVMAQDNSQCLSCHAHREKLTPLVKIDQGTGHEVSMLVDERHFVQSAHGRFPCTDCHPDLEDVVGIHAPELERVDCVTFCHEAVATVLAQSQHVRLMREHQYVPPTCKDCHTGEHSRRDTPVASNVWHRRQSIADCSQCHQEWLHSYQQTLHGQFATLGPVTVGIPTCADCHGDHEVVPAPHPKSRLGITQLPHTCGQCHPGVAAGFLDYIAHPQWRTPEPYPVWFYIQRLSAIVLWSIFLGVTTHTLLWWWRLRRERSAMKE